MISPRDYDPETGHVFEQPFYKVFENGLSVCRSEASDEDIKCFVLEGLADEKPEKPKALQAIYSAHTDVIRKLLDNEGKERLFCVYDQTVSRLVATDTPVPTHAGIFLRYPPKGTNGGRVSRKDCAGKLKEKFLENPEAIEEFRNGLLEEFVTDS